MLTLDFRDALVNNAFRYTNGFNYTNKAGSGIFLPDKVGEDTPFIARDGRYHTDGELILSTSIQFSRRSVTTAKLKEIMDSARMPIRLTFAGVDIYAGKGFLAMRSGHTLGKLLLIACETMGKPATRMNQIKYYIARQGIKGDTYKKLTPVIKSFMDAHMGDIVISDDIEQYIGRRIKIPNANTIAEKKEFVTRLLSHCLKPFCREEPIVPEEPLSPPEEYMKSDAVAKGELLDKAIFGAIDDIDEDLKEVIDLWRSTR